MDKEMPRGAFLEIIERRPGKPDGSFGDEVVVPTEVRLNGQLLAMPADHPVTVHEVEVSSSGDRFVLATLTLLVKRLVVGAEYLDAAAATPASNEIVAGAEVVGLTSPDRVP